MAEKTGEKSSDAVVVASSLSPSTPTTHEWFEKLKLNFAGKILSSRESAPGELEIKVLPTDIVSILEALKTLEGGPFDHLADMTGYDEFPKSPRFYVVYELISMLRKERLAVISPLADDKNPSAPTITQLWSGANWLERETFDMLGIHFTGHPDERRLLLPESFKGHPLQRDFVVDYRQQFPEPVSDAGVFDPFGHTVVKTRESTEKP